MKTLRTLTLFSALAMSFPNPKALACVHDYLCLDAVKLGQLHTIRFLHYFEAIDLSKICDIKRGRISLMHIAAAKGHNEIVEFLLEIGFNINDSNNDFKKTPLDMAIEGGHASTIKLIIKNIELAKKGAYEEVSGTDCKTPFSLCRQIEGWDGIIYQKVN